MKRKLNKEAKIKEIIEENKIEEISDTNITTSSELKEMSGTLFPT